MQKVDLLNVQRIAKSKLMNMPLVISYMNPDQSPNPFIIYSDNIPCMHRRNVLYI